MKISSGGKTKLLPCRILSALVLIANVEVFHILWGGENSIYDE